jgi:hypothetical protein
VPHVERLEDVLGHVVAVWLSGDLLDHQAGDRVVDVAVLVRGADRLGELDRVESAHRVLKPLLTAPEAVAIALGDARRLAQQVADGDPRPG